MTGIIETAAQGFAFSTAILATLRAGSRALYALTTNNELDMMDGPLILSPFDVEELRLQGQEGEVSPLWEITFGFSEAVRHLRNAHENDDEERHKTLNVFRNTWTEEKQSLRYYSMAAPHKSYPSFETTVNRKNHMSDIEKSKTESEGGTSIDCEENADQSLALTSQNKLSLMSSTDTVQKNKSIYFVVFNNFFKNTASFVTTCWIEPVLHFHSMWRRQSRIDDNDFDEEAEELNLDYESIYTSEVTIPVHSGSDPDAEVQAEGKHHPKVARIKVFAPKMFRLLRSRFCIDEEMMIQSMLHNGPYVSFQSNSKGAARVGGFFFFTSDGAFMVKTIKKAEVQAIIEMLPKYYNFMRCNSRRSLLTRFCGLYSVQICTTPESQSQSEEEYVFLIMNSVFPAQASKFISERFDLKGSTVGRECSEEERLEKGSHAVLKDLDLAREVNVMKSLSDSFRSPDYGICIGPTAKAALLSQLRKDLNLLVECSVMDYSLLVGVANLDNVDFKARANIFVRNERGKQLVNEILRSNDWRPSLIMPLLKIITPFRQLLAPTFLIVKLAYNAIIATLSTVLTLPFPYYGADVCGVDGGSLSVLKGKRLGHRAQYYIGVIDFLQPWTINKVLEKELKGLVGYEKTAISCAHPKDYAERFLEYMDKHIT